MFRQNWQTMLNKCCINGHVPTGKVQGQGQLIDYVSTRFLVLFKLWICCKFNRPIQEQWCSFVCCNKFSLDLAILLVQNSACRSPIYTKSKRMSKLGKFEKIHNTFVKVAPLVQVKKLTYLCPFIVHHVIWQHTSLHLILLWITSPLK